MLLRTKALLEADGMVVGWVQCDACADRQIGKGGLMSVMCGIDDEGDENIHHEDVHDEGSVMMVRMTRMGMTTERMVRLSMVRINMLRICITGWA